MKLDGLVKFEEKYISDVYGTTTYYFTIDKVLLDLLRPNQYPEAEHGEISVEFPTGYLELGHTYIQISPTKDGSDYDWSDLILCNEILEKLMDLATNSNLN